MDLDGVEFVAEAPGSTSPASLPSQASKVADDSQEKEDNLMEQNNNVLKEAGVESSQMTVLSVPPSLMAEEEVLEANQTVSASEVFSCAKCTVKTYTSINRLYSHYITKHYKKKIQTFLSKNGDSCNLCGKQMHSAKLALHVGISHQVIQSLLSREGIVVYPQPSNPSNGNVASGNTAVDQLRHQRRLEENAGAEHVEWAVDLLGQPSAPVEAEATVNQRRQEEDAESSGSGSHVGCNFSLTCEVCSQEFRAQHTLQQHYVRHFHEEVNEEANRYFRKFVNSPWISYLLSFHLKF